MHSSTLLIVMLATVLLGVASAVEYRDVNAQQYAPTYNNTLVLARCGDFDTIHGYTYVSTGPEFPVFMPWLSECSQHDTCI